MLEAAVPFQPAVRTDAACSEDAPAGPKLTQRLAAAFAAAALSFSAADPGCGAPCIGRLAHPQEDEAAWLPRVLLGNYLHVFPAHELSLSRACRRHAGSPPETSPRARRWARMPTVAPSARLPAICSLSASPGAPPALPPPPNRSLAIDGAKVGSCLLQKCQSQLAACAHPQPPLLCPRGRLLPANSPTAEAPRPQTARPAAASYFSASPPRSRAAPRPNHGKSPAGEATPDAFPVTSIETTVLFTATATQRSCLADEKCLENLVCLNTCNDRPDEAACQIRCGDLYGDPAVKAFNACAVTNEKCVPQRVTQGLYPIPPKDAVVQKLSTTEYFNGRWCASWGGFAVSRHTLSLSFSNRCTVLCSPARRLLRAPRLCVCRLFPGSPALQVHRRRAEPALRHFPVPGAAAKE